jgi:hypothetical protein
MRRRHPLLSPTGLALTAALLGMFAFAYWRTSGAILAPGDLASVHADIEDCADCHQPLNTTQGELCMDCHTEIRDQTTSGGLHARLDRPAKCFACHPDHRGADFDPRGAALTGFDHSLATFSLAKHSAGYDDLPLECTACHLGEDFVPEPAACADCHTAAHPAYMSAHLDAFGAACLDCHDGADRMENFDHETVFPLEGEHAAAACAGCHAGIPAAETPVECAACHAEPARHAGMFPNTCGGCHNPAGWTPALLHGESFQHFVQTGFDLFHHRQDFDGSLLNCTACHTNALEPVDAQICADCHAAASPDFMTQHLVDFGMACLDCHDGIDRMSAFDHAIFFPLDGAHLEAACTSCHVDHQFAGLPTDCAGCHAEPTVHAGLFGLQCANCHSTAAWQPAALTSHTFPLDHGGEGILSCDTCHTTTYTEYTCTACHAAAEMEEEHDKEDIFDIAGRCTECHPTGREAGD